MRIINLNVNGIRSAARKGFFTWLRKQKADVVCLQEIRAHESQLTDPIFFPKNYYIYYLSAQTKGYSGIGIYTKIKPYTVNNTLRSTYANDEARYLQIELPGQLSIASIYVPSGTSGDKRQAIKYDVLDQYLAILKLQLKVNRNYIICGDWNIAHQKIDIKNWRSNQDNSGFLHKERAWFDALINQVGYVDAFRHKYPDKIQYTWWSNRKKSWEKNNGWRIDYQIISPNLSNKIINAYVYRDKKFSDHAPLIIDYTIDT